MFQLTRGPIRTLGILLAHRAASRTAGFREVRYFSFADKTKEFNQILNEIADEKSDVSMKTMRYLRRTGAVSIMVVIFLVMWASVLQESPVDVAVEEEILDLRKDVRRE